MIFRINITGVVLMNSLVIMKLYTVFLLCAVLSLTRAANKPNQLREEPNNRRSYDKTNNDDQDFDGDDLNDITETKQHRRKNRERKSRKANYWEEHIGPREDDISDYIERRQWEGDDIDGKRRLDDADISRKHKNRRKTKNDRKCQQNRARSSYRRNLTPCTDNWQCSSPICDGYCNSAGYCACNPPTLFCDTYEDCFEQGCWGPCVDNVCTDCQPMPHRSRIKL